MQVVAVDWNSEYMAANNQLAAWGGWGASDSAMLPETADGNPLGYNNIKALFRLEDHKSFPNSAGIELMESTDEMQSQVTPALFCRL